MNLAAYVTVVGIGQQLVNFGRDKLFDRDVPADEYAVNGVLQLAMIPRYAFYKAKEDSIVDAAIDTTIPGLGAGRDMWKDFQLGLKAATDQRDSDGSLTVRGPYDAFRQARTIQYLPAVGRTIYWHAGRGDAQEDKKAMDKSEGRVQKGTLELIGDMFVPPDLGAPRRD
jgi:hypothetical protein